MVRDILKGKIESFNTLIYKYEPAIFKFIFTVVRNEEETKDLTQEVFITVYNKLYSFKEQCKFSNWLYRIARNKSYDYLRKHKRVIKLNIEDAYDVASKELMPEQVVELNEVREELQSFIRGLDDMDRQILILKGLNENMKFADIAEALKLNISTVKSKYYRLWDKYNNFMKEERRCRT